MELILLSKHKGHLGHFSSRQVGIIIGSLVLAICVGAFYTGFRSAVAVGAGDPEEQLQAWGAELAAQEKELDETRRRLQQNVDALALRLGQMNAHVVRLDALGARLTQMADLQDGEFDFTAPPALGGPEELVGDGRGFGLGGIAATLDGLEEQLQDRGRQLNVLEGFLLDRKLHGEVHPEGRPVAAGYISSSFGRRTDPFTGRSAYHNGVDFAGREGSDVLAVASGVVIWSGDRYGFGQLIEVNHGSGYVTRYAHNAKNLVAVGETVKRGQTIARMGRTGRATGPNLHFEVLRHGRPVDPLAYVH